MYKKKYEEEIINEVCKLLLEDTDIDRVDNHTIYSLREEWMKTVEEMKIKAASNIEGYGEQEEEENIEEELSSSLSQFSEEAELRRIEKNTKSYLICLYVKVLRNKGKYKCIFKEGFVNLDGSTDIPFNNGNGELEF